MSDHVPDPIFFNNNKKDWTSRTLPTFHPFTSDNISVLPFCITPQPNTTAPSPTIKEEVICVSSFS